MKNYLSGLVDLTGDSYINPVGASYGDGTGTHQRSERIITSIAVHHDAAGRPHDYDSIARYRQEASGHYNRLGPGLQYHYKIDNTGVIFKTRPHTTWLYALGANENVTSINICLDGYFHAPNNEVPTREQYEALTQLLDWLCTQNPQFPAAQENVYPHRHFSSTACCGDLLVPFVDSYRATHGNVAIPNVPYDWPQFQPSLVVTPPPASTPLPDHSSQEQPVPVVVLPSPAPTNEPAEPSPEPEISSEPQPSGEPLPDASSTPVESPPQTPQPPAQAEVPQPQSSNRSLMSFLTLLYRKIILRNVRGINMQFNFGKYNKAIVAVVGFVLGGLGVVLGVDSPTYFALVQGATILGVYQVPNKVK